MKQQNASRDWLAVASLLLIAFALWTAAYQTKRPIYIDIGGGYDQPFVVNYFKREGLAEGQTSYRWADAYSAIRLPGVGIGAATVQLQLSAPGSPALPLPAIVHLNGVASQQISITAATTAYNVAIPAARIAAGGDGGLGGDLVIYLQTTAAPRPGDKRAVAFQADFARLTWGEGFVAPAPWQLLWLTTGLLLLYALQRRLDLSTRFAFAGGLAYVLVVAAFLVFARLFITCFSDRLALTLLLTHLALWPVKWTLTWFYQKAGFQITSRLKSLLFGVFAAGLAIKLGGLYHPLAFVVDADFHLARIGEVAQNFWRYYAPPGLALRVMPEGDWRTPAVIPYSPFFYMASVPLTWLPGPLDLKIYALSALSDAIRPLFVTFIALRFGWGERVGGYAAMLIAFTPATFLLQQWGNWPTSFSLTFTLIFVALLVGFWPKLDRRAVLWLTALLTLTFVSYTVTAVFLGLTLLGIVVLGGGREWLARLPKPTTALGFVAFNPPASSDPQPRNSVIRAMLAGDHRAQRAAYLRLLLVLVLATTIAMLLFYGQYLNLLITETLPSFAQTAASDGTLKPDSTSWPGYLWLSVQTMLNYSLWPIYILGGLGLAILLLKERGDLAIFGKAILTSFLAVGFLVFLLNYYADMAMKQYWWALPALALAGGWLLGKLSRWADGLEDERGRLILYVLPMVVIVGFILNSLLLWADRLFLHNRA